MNTLSPIFRIVWLIAGFFSCYSGFGQGTFSNQRLLIPRKVDSLWGFCDTAERIVIPPQFEAVDPFIHGVAVFYKDTKNVLKYGLIDTTGKILLTAEYDAIYTMEGGRTYLTKDKVISVRYPSGVIFVPHRFKIEYAFNDEWFVARDGRGRVGVIDTNEHIMIPFRFMSIDHIDEKGYAFAELKNGRTGFIGSNGKFIFSLIKGNPGVASPFTEDLAMFWVEEKKAYGSIHRYGFIDRKGKVVIPAIYKRVDGGFHDGLCAVNNGERSGYINRRGDTILPFIYGGTGYFSNGYGYYTSFNGSGLVDTTGKVVLRVSGEASFHYFNRDFIVVERYAGNFGYVSGLIDLTGRELLPCKYDLIGNPVNGLFSVIEGGNLYYMDMRLHPYRPFTSQTPP